MSDSAPSVLVVEDDPALAQLLVEALPRLDFRAVSVPEAAAASDAIDAHGVDLVLTDVQLGSGSGIQLCAELHEARPELPILVMTAFGTLDTAVEALRAGAFDFLTKPIDLELARIALRRAIEHRDLRQEVHRLRRRARAPAANGLVGESPAMEGLRRMMERVARVDSSVLITGESGTGKEVVARAVHEMGPRQRLPFVAINCGAVPDALLESELFGHVRGAFTDARSARTGLFVQAHGGTLLLDEIGDMPLPLQVKLLRVLQERRVRPVGAESEIEVDVRVMAATHRSLAEIAANGQFREDLLFRLDVIRLTIPPLRERGNDVLLLAQGFVTRFAERFDKPMQGITAEAARRLLAHTWPGNVRELQNCMERAVVLAEADQVRLVDLPDTVRAALPTTTSSARAPALVSAPAVPPRVPAPDGLEPLADVEQRPLRHVLQAVGGNRSRAAEVLGIDRKTLYRKLEAWGDAS